MKKERLIAKVILLQNNNGQLNWLPRNPRQWTQVDIDRTKNSIQRDPDFLEDRPLLVTAGTIVFGGNLRLTAARALKIKEVPVVMYTPENDEDFETIRRRAILDNGSFGAWDYDALANEWDNGRLPDWGVPVWDPEMIAASGGSEETEEEMIERKKREFEERMAAGEISEEDEEYQEFLAKFELKKTTDDCYTPAPVYDAVAKYVEEQYGISRAKFVRPFYPGGDYQKENYPKDCAVVDNPPFSLLAEIVRFYLQRGIRFFLFAPTLTLFSSSPSSSSSCTAIPTKLAVIYENGASVNTSFLTNMDPPHIRLRSAPKLYAMVEEGIKEFTETIKKSLPKYAYPPHIILAPWVGTLSRLGIEFSVPVAESESIAGLDAQKELGKGIYGKGYIVSDRVMAEREKVEREKVEREKAEREKVERWTLSDREIEIIKRLNRQGKRVD